MSGLVMSTSGGSSLILRRRWSGCRRRRSRRTEAAAGPVAAARAERLCELVLRQRLRRVQEQRSRAVSFERGRQRWNREDERLSRGRRRRDEHVLAVGHGIQRLGLMREEPLDAGRRQCRSELRRQRRDQLGELGGTPWARAGGARFSVRGADAPEVGGERRSCGARGEETGSGDYNGVVGGATPAASLRSPAGSPRPPARAALWRRRPRREAPKPARSRARWPPPSRAAGGRGPRRVVSVDRAPALTSALTARGEARGGRFGQRRDVAIIPSRAIVRPAHNDQGGGDGGRPQRRARDRRGGESGEAAESGEREIREPLGEDRPDREREVPRDGEAQPAPKRGGTRRPCAPFRRSATTADDGRRDRQRGRALPTARRGSRGSGRSRIRSESEPRPQHLPA